MLFAAIAFLLLAHRKGMLKSIPAWRRRSFLWLGLSLVAFAGAWVLVNQLIAGNANIVVIIFSHFLLISSVALAAVGSFGFATITELARNYKKQLLQAAAIAVVFYGFLTLVYGLWQVLAGIVLHAVKLLLELSGLSVAVVPPLTLLLDKFGITVAEYCSGVESIALFTSLYAIVGLLDWQKLNHKKYFLLFPLALTILFGLNILRVYALILAGYYIDPGIAFSLFHTYAGMVFFIAYSAIFWLTCYKWLLKK